METKQAILDEAGLRHFVENETLSGSANGTNKVFTAAHRPITDRNDDDVVDAHDVTVYVNGASVTVSGVNETTGAITLLAAPANGATVTCDYYFSNVSDEYVAKALEEAEDWIETEMEGIDPAPYDEVPKTIRKITRYYAAGLLLLKDYGDRSDTEEMSKNGDQKIKKAEKWLARYIELGGATGLTTTEDDNAEVQADPALFTTYDREEEEYHYASDDEFMRGLRSEENL